MKYNTAILVARRQLDTATAQCINGSKKQTHVLKYMFTKRAWPNISTHFRWL